MDQLELFESGELEPIQKWLHVWDEARREAVRKKAPSATALETQGQNLAEAQVGGDHQAASSYTSGRNS